MNAATQGKLNVIDKYLADGGDPNVHDELKRTALHRASLEGHATVVQSLLEKGADLGSRAIHWACRGGSLEVVKALKSHGDDLNVRDKEGVTAVQQVKEWQFDIMETLQSMEKLREVGLVLPENTTTKE
uniref:Ankyrin repeat domain-containing protein 2-like n=1 Tax=Seriola dumerili TaxID=41447 RepID=A0A3B4TY22_SERDU